MKMLGITLLFPLLVAQGCVALLEEAFVSFEPSDDAIEVQNATIVYDAADPVGIRIAANSLADDFHQITGVTPPIVPWTNSGKCNQTDDTATLSLTKHMVTPGSAIIPATVDSALIRQLEEAGKLEVEEIRGKWETFRTTLVKNPLPGITSGLVIAGSDKRGVMFGVYTLSEQSGQSPLHWWADVPATKHEKIYALDKVTTHGEPSVKYRGLFINDEAPALTGWWGKTQNVSDYTFGADFYEHVFDLLLRLKANFIWPAMWASWVPEPGRIFFTDDPRNQQLADDYGIVVSTSHHEPMQRATNEWRAAPKGPWDWATNKDNVTEFMDGGVRRAGHNESYFTVGMRGEADSAIEGDDPITILEDVFDTQRAIFAKYYGNETAVNQVWTIYKEVATYYAAGLVPPEDITLMFTDDNWGNVRRLPTDEERKRSGGAGLYYHFEYVGSPRSWKWQNTNNFPKIYKELYQTYQRGADRIWIMNVADIKPVELPLSFALDLAWNTSRFDFDTIPSYLEALATRDFGREYAKDIASALMQYSHLVGMRKFELTDFATYSVLNFQEADRILEAWRSVSNQAQALHDAVPENRRDALYHLLVYPAASGYNYHRVVIGLGKNRQFGYERRNSANAVAERVLQHFEEDYDLTAAYDKMADGKWEGIMSTAKFDMDIDSWRSPSSDAISGLSYVQLRQPFDYGVGDLGIYVEQSQSAARQARYVASIDSSLPTEDDFAPTMRVMQPHGQASRFIELFHRGDYRQPVSWSLEVPHSWIKVSATSGTVSKDEPDHRINVTIDWESVPANFNETVPIRVSWEPEPYFDLVHLPVANQRAPVHFVGFPETDGLISIEAPHFQRSSGASDENAVAFSHIPYLGSRSESGSVGLRPYSAAMESANQSKMAWVEYDIYIFGNETRDNVTATFYVNGALDTHPDRPMEVSLTLQGSSGANFTRLLGVPEEAGDQPPEWSDSVANHVWTRTVDLGNLQPGNHTLKWQVSSPEVYLEKIVVVITGTLPDSYLGLPETSLVGA